jgi:hypothetical protein
MTRPLSPKQAYDERKRLRIENDLRAEQRRKEGFDREDEFEARMLSLLTSMQRIADVLELWADQQYDNVAPPTFGDGQAPL